MYSIVTSKKKIFKKKIEHFNVQSSHFYSFKPGLHVRRKHKHKHKKPTCKPVRRKHKRLVLALVFMLTSFRLTRTNDASISTSTRKWNDLHSLLLVPMFVSLGRKCKSGRRKHKHKRKERKLKNSEKLSAYILVTHAFPFSVKLESNLAPKGNPGACLIAPIFYALAYSTLCLCLSYV